MPLFGQQLYLTHQVPQAAAAQAQAVAADDGETLPPAVASRPADIDLKNILALVPAEAMAPFVSFKDTVPANFSAAVWAWVLLVLCGIICVVVRALATQPGNSKTLVKDVNWRLVVVSLGAFFIWAHATTESTLLLPYFHGPFAGIVGSIYGLLVPRLVPSIPVQGVNRG